MAIELQIENQNPVNLKLGSVHVESPFIPDDSIEDAKLIQEGGVLSRVAQLQSDLEGVSGNVTSVTGRVTTAEGKIATLEGKMATAEGNITSVTGRVSTAEGNITSLDGRLDKVSSALDKYNYKLYRGSANINNGSVGLSDSVLNRLTSAEYIDISMYDTMAISGAWDYYVLYYDANKGYIGTSESYWRSVSVYHFDTTKAYARLLVKNFAGDNIATVPSNAITLYNSQKLYLTESAFTSAGDSIYPLYYKGLYQDTGMANTVRWFLPETLPSGWLSKIVNKFCRNQGIVTVELWAESSGTIARYATYEFPCTPNVQDQDLIINAPVKDGTYLSFKATVTGTLLCDNSATGDILYILRDLDTTSFAKASLQTFSNYRAGVDVYLWTLPKQAEIEEHIYTIGENDNVAEVITEAMKHTDSTVYILPYEHDCIQEWKDFYGANYFDNMSAGRGLELQNGVHVIGRSGHKLKCYYTGNNDYVMENFSLFNNPAGGSGYILENLNIDVKKIRYCIHDERGSDTVPYKVEYKRCKMSQDMTGSTWDHSRACIGGGLGQHGDVVVEDCIFSTITSSANMDSLAYHNSAGAEAENNLVIKNCYCTGDSTLQLAAYGDSTAKTKVLVANCSFGSPIEILDWSGNENFDIYQINNEVRNS